MLVPGNLKLVIIHRDKPRTGSLERVARSRDALQGRQPVRKRKGEGLVVSRYRASCMEITGIPAGPLSLSISPPRGSGRHNDLRFEIKSRLYNPPLLLSSLLPLFSISSLPERVFESINLGNRFSSRFASRRKKKRTKEKQGEKREYSLLHARHGRNHFRARIFFPLPSLFALTSERVSRFRWWTIIRWTESAVSRRISPGRFANLIDRRGERCRVCTIIELIEER